MMKSKMMAAGGMMKKGYAAGGMIIRQPTRTPVAGVGRPIPRQAVDAIPKPTRPMPTRTPVAGAGRPMPRPMKKGGAMEMVEKNGKKVPAFAADGVGKMAKGGMAKAKMMASGGMTKKGAASGGAKGKK